MVVYNFIGKYLEEGVVLTGVFKYYKKREMELVSSALNKERGVK